jgi:hypothetical protein
MFEAVAVQAYVLPFVSPRTVRCATTAYPDAVKPLPGAPPSDDAHDAAKM